jgi:hypothetical protein
LAAFVLEHGLSWQLTPTDQLSTSNRVFERVFLRHAFAQTTDGRLQVKSTKLLSVLTQRFSISLR